MGNKNTSRRHGPGFTLIELMIVVSIIGILAATAIPLFSKYVKKAKTAEVTIYLRKIYDGELTYYQEERVNYFGAVIFKQFVQTEVTPPFSTLGQNKRAGDWTTPAWMALKFAADGPVQFSYQGLAAGTGMNASFTVGACGDLDGNGATSRFYRTAYVSPVTGEIQGGAGIYTADEIQ